MEYTNSSEYEGANSIVFLSAAEDIFCGGSNGACDTATFDDPLYVASGGATGFTKWGGFGLGAYSVYFAVANREGTDDGTTTYTDGAGTWATEA